MNAVRLAVLVAALAAHGCASLNASPNGAAWWRVARPEWVPPQGLEWAIAQCNAHAAGVSGYDWIDAGSKKAEARSACMTAFGYAH